MKKERVIIGLSGGVDSAVSAWLLQQQGYQVQAIFMKNWEGNDQCYTDQKDAQAVCDHLGIPFYTVNFSQQYENKVFRTFLHEYQAGRTPNPDILCNKEIKFKLFLKYARCLGADLIATGHYAGKQMIRHRCRLIKGLDLNKDQSYFLYTLDQAQLAQTLFPLALYCKPKVRQLAQKIRLPNYAKKDSTGICFIGERRFSGFLKSYLGTQPGSIQTLDGKTIGMHQGLMYYTLGQRRGLNIGGYRFGTQQPWYVVDKNLSRNILIVAQGKDHPALYASQLIAKDIHWVDQPPQFPYYCAAKTRYRQQESDCYIVFERGYHHVSFKQPQWAMTPGQSIVFYQGNQCLGGGIIESVMR